MRFFRISLTFVSLLCDYALADEPVKVVAFRDYGEAKISIKNYHDDGEPICELNIVDNNSKTDRYMFDSCGNLELSELDKEYFKFEVINYRGNQKKIVYTDASFSILGVINVDLSDNSTEVIENNFKCIPSIIGLDTADKNMLDKFKSH
ncbi:hypothetical protein CGT95_00610 [Vibrio metoecus]|uniref:Uncharacterized protein n=2 Tax=Vibrio TaxID=662 RepID=A0A271VYH1_VIBMT|nr:hypothetical protein XV94_14005 [Vibrio metoecus]PAR23101.1 hypothetical protein CGU03_01055 [Vibrio metoecus]PAR25569.1 hypothetical protein CGU02_03530 [Vibrio metoecus]PAR48412.1 hypothetical protein CGT95_00610 [Vibrio metoecus]